MEREEGSRTVQKEGTLVAFLFVCWWKILFPQLIVWTDDACGLVRPPPLPLVSRKANLARECSGRCCTDSSTTPRRNTRYTPLSIAPGLCPGTTHTKNSSSYLALFSLPRVPFFRPYRQHTYIHTQKKKNPKTCEFRLEHPCDGCNAPYGYLHHMSLSSDSNLFTVSDDHQVSFSHSLSLSLLSVILQC